MSGRSGTEGTGRDRGSAEGSGRRDKDLFIMMMEGDMECVLDRLRRNRGLPVKVIERAIEVLIGLALKGYEGKPTGAIYLIGDVEGVRRNTTQMIINPFKGWNKVSILDPKQLPTFEAYTQLDGALLMDSRGYARSAGMMIHVRESDGHNDHRAEDPIGHGKGRGTRWRAGRHITSQTGTVALVLSHRGDITIFHMGKEIGRFGRSIRKVTRDEADRFLGRTCSEPMGMEKD